MPSVTVIIPNWNGARWLEGCLDSVARQSLAPAEALVVDNGSTDGSARRAGRRPGVRVLDLGRNTGFAAAANRGFDAVDPGAEAVALLNPDVALAPDWLERTNREEEEHSSVLVDQLKLKPGEVVADIGCGTGYMSRRLAKKVLPGGRVLGVDIQPEMLALLRTEMLKAGITNVVPVLGTITDPRLPTNSVDLVLLVDVYHEFDHPYEMTEAILRGLKPGGRLVFVEFRAEDPDVPIKDVHKMTAAQVKKEMGAFALDWTETIGVLPWLHIIIFRKREK